MVLMWCVILARCSSSTSGVNRKLYVDTTLSWEEVQGPHACTRKVVAGRCLFMTAGCEQKIAIVPLCLSILGGRKL